VTPVAANGCPVCSQSVSGGACGNALCRDRDRAISRIAAIAVYDGELADRIKRYKYRKATGWSIIFGRLLLNWLENNYYDPDDVDMITMIPSWAGPGGKRNWHHTELIIDQAAIADTRHRWSFDALDPRWITTAGPSPPSAGGGLPAKKAAAQEVAQLVRIHTDVEGQRIVLFDDICTTGYQLDAVAGRMLKAGAADVTGVVIGRSPWR